MGNTPPGATFACCFTVNDNDLIVVLTPTAQAALDLRHNLRDQPRARLVSLITVQHSGVLPENPSWDSYTILDLRTDGELENQILEHIRP